MRARICGTGSCLPKLRVANDDLSKVVDTSDAWIRSRTGIAARHIVTDETTAGMALEAAKQALAEADMRPEELDLIIAASVSADRILPPLSCELQSGLGAVRASAYDLCAACSGFLFALNAAQAYIQSGMFQKILIVGAETLSKLVDWSDRSTCVLFGDGAGAVVVCADEEGVLATVQGSDGARGMVLACEGRPVNNPYVRHEAGNPYVQMNGQEVYRFAVRTVPASVQEALQKAGLAPEDISLFLLHQANRRIIEAVAKRLAQPPEKFPMCLEECGNMSAASVPVLLDRVNKEKKLKKGDKIVLAGFGAGLTWGCAVLVW